MAEFTNVMRVSPGTAYTTGNDVGSTTVTLADGGPMVVSITTVVSTAAKLLLRINSTNFTFNTDTALTADALYTFSFIGHPNDTFSFRFDTNCTIRYFVVAKSRG